MIKNIQELIEKNHREEEAIEGGWNKIYLKYCILGKGDKPC